MAAGLGTRLLPLTRFSSKPMVPVLNRPVLEHLIKLLARHGVTELATNLHYQPDEIRRHFECGSAFGVDLRYRLELDLSGTAGGTELFRTFLSDGTFLVMSGDALTDADLSALLARHREHGGIATMAVKRIADPSLYGVVVTDADGRVTGFQEKPAAAKALSNLCNCGIYAFEPEIFRYIPSGRFVDYALDVFPALLADRRSFSVWQLDGYWSDVGSLDQYLGANSDALEGHVTLETPGEEVRRRVWLEPRAEVSPRAVLRAPLLLGRGCRVAAGASLAGPLVLGDQCVVDADAVVERSVLWAGCSVGAGASIDGAIIGRRVRIGAGAVVSHGAVIADGCVVPDHAVVPGDARLEPGTVAGAARARA